MTGAACLRDLRRQDGIHFEVRFLVEVEALGWDQLRGRPGRFCQKSRVLFSTRKVSRKVGCNKSLRNYDHILMYIITGMKSKFESEIEPTLAFKRLIQQQSTVAMILLGPLVWIAVEQASKVDHL